MATAYRIKDWDQHFENATSRKLVRCAYTLVPNKHDGKGWKRFTRHPEAITAMCGWFLLIQVASKMRVRGLLADENGPLTVVDMADATGMPEEVFEAAIRVASLPTIGWLEAVEIAGRTVSPGDATESAGVPPKLADSVPNPPDSDETRTGHPSSPPKSAGETQNSGPESKGREGIDQSNNDAQILAETESEMFGDEEREKVARASIYRQMKLTSHKYFLSPIHRDRLVKWAVDFGVEHVVEAMVAAQNAKPARTGDGFCTYVEKTLASRAADRAEADRRRGPVISSSNPAPRPFVDGGAKPLSRPSFIKRPEVKADVN